MLENVLFYFLHFFKNYYSFMKALFNLFAKYFNIVNNKHFDGLYDGYLIVTINSIYK